MKNDSFSGGLKTQSDTVLLQLMAGTDEVLRLKAFNCFYERHGNDLAKLCNKACKVHAEIYGSDLPDIVFNNTLLEVYQHPLQFLRRLEEQHDASGKKLEVGVLLSTMADEELEKEKKGSQMRYGRGKTEVKNDAELDLFAQQMNPCHEAEEVNDQKRHEDAVALGADLNSLDAACNKLKPRDKAVIDFIKTYDLPNKQLPKEEKEQFLKEQGLKPENFRKCKERSFKKLRARVLEDRHKSAAQSGSASAEAPSC
jgi:hypothetical protein